MRVKFKIMHGFAELGTLEGDLDPHKLPKHGELKDKEDPQHDDKCAEALQQLLVKTEIAANSGPLRLHLSVE